MDIEQFVTSGLLERVTTEGRATLILKKPVRLVVPTALLNQLANIYPKDHETGGFLYAGAETRTGTLTVQQVAQLANQATNQTTYQASGADYQRGIDAAIRQGLLPLRFHTHPLQTLNSLYNRQALSFFQKTSTTDRHSSYTPVYVGNQALVLPDCLISPNDREGKQIRFSLYNGFVAPTSVSALLPNEQYFIGFVVLALTVYGAVAGWKKAARAFAVCVLVGLVVFIREKRPTYTYTESGLIITI